MRIPFLVLTPASVMLAVGAALYAGHNISMALAAAILCAALLAHVSVNTLNEYFDYGSGLDSLTTRTPFSGGSGALVENPAAASRVLAVGIGSLVLSMAGGLYFVYLRGVELVPLGLAGAIIIVSYTPWLNRHPWLCLLAPGIAFGPLMVCGSYFVLTGEFSLLVLMLSMVPFLLANNLLLLNQFPDTHADRQAGRKHFPIAYGERNSLRVYALFVAVAALLIAWLTVSGSVTPGLLFALWPLLAAVYAVLGMQTAIRERTSMLPCLAANVIAAVLTPAVMSLALIISA